MKRNNSLNNVKIKMQISTRPNKYLCVYQFNKTNSVI